MMKKLKTKPRLAVQVVCAIGILFGVGFIISPLVVAWWNAQQQEKEVSYYVTRAVESDVDQKLAEAEAYNEGLTQIRVTDPYRGDQPAGSDEYWQALTLDGTGAIGAILIPGATPLPIYHGTSKAVMDRGVGHLYGSSLPVGGSGTHVVLSAHSGVADNKLFDAVHKLHLEDKFALQVLGRDLVYQVNQVQVVSPAEAEKLLRIEDGKDQVTLVTCYPYGVNTHRLLVTGQRVEDDTATIGSVSSVTLLATWAVPVAVLVAASGGWGLWSARRRKQRRLSATSRGFVS